MKEKSMHLPDSIRNYTQNKEYHTDDVGMSESTVLLYDDMVLKITPYRPWIDTEAAMLRWLAGKIPAPRLICHEVEEETSYLLISRIEGKMSCDDFYMKQPEKLIGLLADAIKMLWSVDVSDCPVTKNLDEELAEARYNVEHGKVDMDNVQPDTFGEGGFANPEELIGWLETHKPECGAVLSHGDFCLPNIFLKDDKVSGFIDLGGCGVADKWRDISLCYRSLKDNYEGLYKGGKTYAGFRPEMLFEKLGIEPDYEKLRYWILLDELF